MDVLLISPASPEDRLRRNKYVTYAPVTLPMLAALTPPDCRVSLIDEKVEPIDFGRKPDLVGITAITGTAPRSYEVAQRFRDMGCAVVLGGPHPSVMPDEAAQHADAVVVGQAYRTWPACVRDFQAGRLAPRYVDDQPPPADVPVPRRSLLRRSRYITANSIQATLGCPNACEFCVVPSVYGGGFRARRLESVVEEIRRLPGRGVFFVDVNLTADPGFARRLFEEMIPLKKVWAAQVTTGFTDDRALLDLAARAGCKGLFLGVESLSQASLDAANKGTNRVGYYEEMQRKLRDHGICSMFGMVFGFDQDDPTIFDQTFRFLDRIRADTVRYGILTPFPGTALFRRLEREGRILDRDWERYDSSHVVFQPKRMSPEALQHGYYRAMNHTYALPSILRRILGSRSFPLLSIPINYGYWTETNRLYRRFRTASGA